MHDPLAPLTRPDPSPASPSLPAAEVRRRGDRLRRRRRMAGVATGVAALAAVALVVTTLPGDAGSTPSPAPVGTPSRGAEPTPSEPATERPTPEPGFRATIPDDFPLALGLPAPGGEVSERETADESANAWWFDPCHDGTSATDPLRLDESYVSQSAPVSGWGRQLVLFPDGKSASAAMSELVGAMDRCPTYRYEDGVSDEVLAEVGPPLRVGDESFAVVSHSRTDGQITTLASLFGVVRVGNAVLVTARHGEFGASMPEDLEAFVADELQPTLRLAQKMCVFAHDDAGRRSPCDS